MKQLPGDPERARYLELCEELAQRVGTMRNYGMKPGNAWLARSELSKISGLISDLETNLQAIKEADESDQN